MRILKNPTFDFVSKRHLAIGISVAAILVSAVLLFVRGLNLGVDFAGGTSIQVKFNKDITAKEVRDTMHTLGFEKASVQVYGAPENHEYLVRVRRISLLTPKEHDEISKAVKAKMGSDVDVAAYNPDKGDAIDLASTHPLDKAGLKTLIEGLGVRVDEVHGGGREQRYQYTVILEGVSTRLEKQLDAQLGKGVAQLRRVEYVGPQVGKQLRTAGFLSLLYACVFILIYLAIRFDFRYAPGAVLALGHDAFLTVGFYCLTGLEFNLTSIAAILTIIGYSVNDTVIIYDRIREDASRYQGRPLPDIINTAVNETLSRTIITSLTTVMSLVGLWFFARGTIWAFAVAMTFGIVVGTYSSVYVASPLVLFIDSVIKRQGKKHASSKSGGSAKSQAA